MQARVFMWPSAAPLAGTPFRVSAFLNKAAVGGRVQAGTPAHGEQSGSSPGQTRIRTARCASLFCKHVLAFAWHSDADNLSSSTTLPPSLPGLFPRNKMVQRYDRVMRRCLQVTLAEYLTDLMPASFKGNETLAEIEASPVWKDPAHEWIVQNKVLRLPRLHAWSTDQSVCTYT